ncbi:MAG: glutamate 5-kinase [Fimbriimonadaceae bacterium]|nr:glutamate 5-kinase [Fimbriimonadaceae bacterium]
MGEAPVLVVKVGTKVLTTARGDLDLNYIRELAGQLAALQHAGWGVVLVTSGAIRAGMRALGLTKCRDLRLQQAAAAVGQIQLMRLYADHFRDHGVTVAQILLTRGDVTDRRRYLNARNTLLALLGHGVVPVINENDTVAVDEIQFGENDQLAAQVVQLVGAELLVFLTDTEGFLMPDASGKLQLVPEVAEITEEMLRAAGGSVSGLGSGGMTTKLGGARMATRVGCRVVMARGKGADGVPPVWAVAQGEARGTNFLASPHLLRGRKRWLAQSGDAEGTLQIDSGAVEAIGPGGKSLLAVGLGEVEGDFEPGALVRVVDAAGHEVARGLSNYSSEQLRLIRGLKSWDIAAALGYDGGAEVIHRDNLALTDETVLR